MALWDDAILIGVVWMTFYFTPATFRTEVAKLGRDLEIVAVHIKPAYRQMIIDELNALKIPGLGVMEPGKTYNF